MPVLEIEEAILVLGSRHLLLGSVSCYTVAPDICTSGLLASRIMKPQAFLKS